MIITVYAGCQSGADFGGLLAAEKYGIPTGGMMPKGFLTEVGPKPDWAKRFNLTESKSKSYATRTYDNAKNSDGTIRFAYNFDSRGTIMTKEACEKYQKPVIDVDVENPLSSDVVVAWIKANNIKILNIAGNRASVCPYIQDFVVKYLSEVFEKLGFTKCEKA